MTHSFLQLLSAGWLRPLLIALLFMFAAAQPDAILAETAPMAPGLELTFNDGLISAELVDVPLVDVLERIKQEFGFKTHYHGDLTERITVSFTDLPLAKCLRLLTANQSLSIATRPVADGSAAQNETKQIAEIWVLSRSPVSKSANIAPAASLLPGPNQPDSMGSSRDELPEPAEGMQPEDVFSEPGNDQKTEELSKRQTINNLAAIGDSASVMAMAEYTRDADKEIRKLSVNGISSVQSEESTQILGQVLQDESDPEIRKIALRALGQRQNDMAAQALLEGALNDADVEVKDLADQLLTQ